MQKPYHNANSLDYNGTLSRQPTPYLRRTTDEHKGAGKGKDIRPRTTTIALSDCVVKRADGTEYVIESARNRSAAKRKTQKAVKVQREVAEVQRLADNRSMDEIRRVNGL